MKVTEKTKRVPFKCNVAECKGICCSAPDGGVGAPLDEEDIVGIKDNLSGILPLLDRRSQELIERVGISELDEDDDEQVTICHTDGRCVFSIIYNDVLSCGIEKAYVNRKSTFKKPLSCSLYPLRKVGDELVYDKWDICDPAITEGIKTSTTLGVFVKDSIIEAKKRYGK